MVSNEEISQKLRAKREGMPLNYLVCNRCGGYYELQHGESPSEFDLECECGGQLIQTTRSSLLPPGAEYLSKEEYEHKRYATEITGAYVLLVWFGILAPVMGIYLITRDNKRANFHGKIVLVLSLIVIFIFIFIIFLI